MNKKFYPVIHVVNEKLAIDNINICVDSEVSGVFLISHKLNYKKFIPIAITLRNLFPDVWMGINILDCNISKALLELPDKKMVINDKCIFQGYWSDTTYVVSDKDKNNQWAAGALNNMHHRGIIFFGGFAFKYQAEVKDMENEAKLTSNFVDYLTTSGDATGYPPTPEKIQRIRNAVGDKAIAIASGISINNVETFGMADAFLVASSIGKTFTELDPIKTKELAGIIRKM